MKRVLITTFQRAENYGAMLQAYALRSVLEDMGYDVKFLDYRNKSIEAPYWLFPLKGWKGKQAIKVFLRSVIFIFPNCIRKYRFFKFRKEYLGLEKRGSSFCPDCYITGSDQVWNTEITQGLSDIYTLNFRKTKARYVSYAASIGKGVLTECEKKMFQQKLEHLDAISVRENTAKTLLEMIFKDKTIKVVLDPTLLLTSREWEEKLQNVKIHTRKKYILAYMVEENEEFRKIVEKLSETTGLKVVHFERRNHWKDAKSYYTAGVLEFVSYIKDAEYVVTTSFHATVFSVIFNKKFWVIPHETTGSRVADLLVNFKITNRMVNSVSEFSSRQYDEAIDYKKVNQLLELSREESIKWLKEEVEDNYE